MAGGVMELMAMTEKASSTRRLKAMKCLPSELTQVVIDVLVHQLPPLLAGHLPEEGVRLGAGLRRAVGDEAVDEVREARALGGEFALVGDDEGGVGRRVLAEGLLAEDR